MYRLAIFIDGGYVDKLTRALGIRIDYAKFVDEIIAALSTKTPNALDLLRTYYYDCLPYQSNPPIQRMRRNSGMPRMNESPWISSS